MVVPRFVQHCVPVVELRKRLIVVRRLYICAEIEISGVGTLCSCKYSQKRRLAAPVRADNKYALALQNMKVNSVENMLIPVRFSYAVSHEHIVSAYLPRAESKMYRCKITLGFHKRRLQALYLLKL